MKDIIKNIAALIKVKTIVTFAVVLVFSILALRGAIAPNDVKDIVYIVIAFYFGTQYDKKILDTSNKS